MTFARGFTPYVVVRYEAFTYARRGKAVNFAEMGVVGEFTAS